MFLGDMEPFGRGSYYFCEGRRSVIVDFGKAPSDYDAEMPMRERVLGDIEESINAIDDELHHTKKDWFTQLAFEKWALTEMRDLILQKPDTSPWVIVEEFMNLMDQYSLECHPNNYAFCVAYDTAWAVLAELIGGEPPH